MLGQSSIEAIHLIRSLMEKYRERQKDMHLAFIDLEKAYDNVPQSPAMKKWKFVLDKGMSSQQKRMFFKDVKHSKEITETFPLETLGMVTFRGDDNAPWFADLAKYHAGNFVIKGMSSQQKRK
ncbi:hypothetical protein Tco_1232917 [Tanacetum coccineum]